MRGNVLQVGVIRDVDGNVLTSKESGAKEVL